MKSFASQPVEIRQEADADHATIGRVTEVAFRDMPYAGGDEQTVIERLRSAGALSLSLVALVDRQIVGHVAFSPAHAADATRRWYALGPVSVLPAHQRQGIGSALIETGLAELQARGARGCILIGDPAYYRRFGFELSPQNVPENEPEDYFMVKLFSGALPSGAFRFHPAFY